MRAITFSIFFLILVGCETAPKHDHAIRYELLNGIIIGIENDGKQLMQEIELVGDFTQGLFAHQDTVNFFHKPPKYHIIDGVSSNRPGDGSDMSTIFISNLSKDKGAALREVVLMNPLDSVFEGVKFKFPLVSQVYSNSMNQVSRVYPSFDAVNLLEPDLDLTSFNFFYEANEENNPERVTRWLPDPYIDPAGRGWIVSLVTPVYQDGMLHTVIGIDFKVEEVLAPYFESLDGDFLVVTGKGDIVAGSPQAINQLGFPPLKNHVYQETIRSDNFRISDYNLYNSKSPEVREMAQSLLLSTNDHFQFKEEVGLKCAIASRFKLVDWLVIEILN